MTHPKFGGSTRVGHERFGRIFSKKKNQTYYREMITIVARINK